MIVAAVTAVPLLAVVLRGMSATYRGRRHEYYTRTKVTLLIAGFAAVGVLAMVGGATGPAWAAFALAGWIGLEGVFHLILTRREK